MLTPNGDGAYTGGLLDVILIYHYIVGGTFHPVLFVESPMPGPMPDLNDTAGVRLMSNIHHTTGFKSLVEAQENVREEMRKQFILPDVNVAIENAIPWDGELGDVWIVQNWRRGGTDVNFAEVNLVGVETAEVR